MGLITKTVKIKPSKSQQKHYRERGYSFNFGDEIKVSIEDLPLGSHAIIQCSCDYCGTIINKPYYEYNEIMKGLLPKIACKNCKSQKEREICILKYGVDNISKIIEVKEKKKELALEKYGVENVFQSEEVKDKIRQGNLEKYGYEYTGEVPAFIEKRKSTCIERYGFETPSKNKEVSKKARITCLEKYGVEYTLQSPIVQAKGIVTNLTKYGVSHPSQSNIIKEKIAKSLYVNSTQKASKQQKYICDLFKGILNYPCGPYSLDIVIDNFDIEYDGSGHRLSVDLGNINDINFLQKNIARDRVVKSVGFRIIRIISRKDYLPSDTILIQMLQYARDFFALNPERSWISFDIDNNCIYSAYHKESSSRLPYDFGPLRKIKKSDVTSITDQKEN